MKPETLIALVTDSVVDALRSALPEMIATECAKQLAPIEKRIVGVDMDLDALQAEADGKLAALEATTAKKIDAADWQAVLVSLRSDLDTLKRAPGMIAADAVARVEAIERRVDAVRADLDALEATAATALDSEEWQRGIAEIRGDVEAVRTEAKERALSTLTLLEATLAADVAEAVKAIPPAPAGPRGPPGRDATFVAPVHWEKGRVFSRGAVVQHAGGLWYANADTSAEPGSPCSGFSVIVDGAEPAGFERDERGVVAVYRYASGVERRLPLGVYPMEHAGIFEPERSYSPQQCVTLDGSVWLARSDVQGKRPGTDEGARYWTLVVKRGRDGRDGLQGMVGPRGERGETGPPGKDSPRATTRAKPNGTAPT